MYTVSAVLNAEGRYDDKNKQVGFLKQMPNKAKLIKNDLADS